MKLEFIKKKCSEGDSVSFKTKTGDSFSGKILEFDDDIIIIVNEDGDEEYISVESIDTFKKFITGITPSAASTSVTQEQIPAKTEPKAEVLPVQEIVSETSSQAEVASKPQITTKGLTSVAQTHATEKLQVKEVVKPATIKLKDPKKRVFSSLDDFGANVLSGIGNETVKEKNDREKKEAEEAEGNQVVREMGTISSCGDVYGFIQDNITHKRLYFNVKELLDLDPKKNIVGQYVVYTKSLNYQGDTAISIHKPDTINNLLLLVDDLMKKNRKYDAFEVINHINKSYPDTKAVRLKQYELTSKRTQQSAKPIKVADNCYLQAVTCKKLKQYDKALELFDKAIEKQQKVDSAIKDKGMLYVHLAKIKKPTDSRDYLKEADLFMEKHVHLLEENLIKWQYLENFYFSIKNYLQFKIAALKLLSDPGINNDGPRYVLLLNKLAGVFIKEGDIERAREYINKSIETYPDGTASKRMLAIIDQAEDISSWEIEDIISANEIESFMGGLSPYITKTLDEYDEYAGANAKNIESKHFTKEDLKEVRKLVNTFNEAGGRPNDRARYLLTEAKLMQQFEPNNSDQFRSVMARYCNDMARVHIINQSQREVTRFFLNEAFGLTQKFETTARQASIFLMTIHATPEQLSRELSFSTTLANALSGAINSDVEPWNIILEMLLYNSEITAKVISILYGDTNLRQKAVKALKQWDPSLPATLDTEKFTFAWNRAREKRLNDYRKAVSDIFTLASSNSILEIAKAFKENIPDIRKEWMSSLDKSRLTTIATIVAPSLENYYQSIGYRNKELNYNSAYLLLDKMKGEILSEPTKLSFEAILPLAENIQEIITKDFDNFKNASDIRPMISLLSSNTVVDNHQVNLQIEVSLDKDSSPISNVKIEVLTDDDIRQVESGENNPNLSLVEGGDSITFLPVVETSEKVIQEQAASFTVKCTYFRAGVEQTCEEPLSLHLYDSEDFSLIPNPYASVAESGPLSADSNMFYGHDGIIKRSVSTILESPTKQVLIYGQKRSGKSSVLNRIEHELKDAGAFCIKFSLGQIIRKFSEAAFFHRILDEISEELKMMREDGDIAPEFTVPSKEDFIKEDLDNPVVPFTKYMRAFNRACQRTLGWENKRLVVLIDEFTYMYGAIKAGVILPTIMQQWKAVTQDDRATFSVVLVGQDVIPAFKNEPYTRNAFGVISDERLTYLSFDDAKQLVETPILNDGKSRFLGDATELILDYTACSPYYIQIFCSRLVQYMNDKHYIQLTKNDVKSVAQEMVSGVHALDEGKFENLLSARETDDEDNVEGAALDDAIRVYKDEDVKNVLRAVAKASSTKIDANIKELKVSIEETKLKGILKQLCDREVLENRDDNYRIKVRLYKEWLLNH